MPIASFVLSIIAFIVSALLAINTFIERDTPFRSAEYQKTFTELANAVNGAYRMCGLTNVRAEAPTIPGERRDPIAALF